MADLGTIEVKLVGDLLLRAIAELATARRHRDDVREEFQIACARGEADSAWAALVRSSENALELAILHVLEAAGEATPRITHVHR